MALVAMDYYTYLYIKEQSSLIETVIDDTEIDERTLHSIQILVVQHSIRYIITPILLASTITSIVLSVTISRLWQNKWVAT